MRMIGVVTLCTNAHYRASLLFLDAYGMVKVCDSKQMMAFVQQLGECVMTYGGDYNAREDCQKNVCQQKIPDLATIAKLSKLLKTALIVTLLVDNLYKKN